jgi:hypothetical protein
MGTEAFGSAEGKRFLLFPRQDGHKIIGIMRKAAFAAS